MSGHQISCSFFRHARDNRPSAWRGPWQDLLLILRKEYQPTVTLEGDEAKKGLPAISGASFLDGHTRRGINVQHVQVAFLDFDNTRAVETGERHESGRPVTIKTPLDRPALLTEVAGALGQSGTTAVLWTTWSNRPDHPRFRAAVPLAEPVPPANWPSLLAWLLDRCRLRQWVGAIDLPCALDVARMNFLPARRPGGPPVEWAETTGSILTAPPLATLASMPSSGRQDSIGPAPRRSRPYSGITLGDPDALRLLASLGCRVGPASTWGSGVKHRTTCPWYGEHSHGLDDDAAVLFMEPGYRPVWRCSHSGHAHLGLFDLLDAAGRLG